MATIWERILYALGFRRVKQLSFEAEQNLLDALQHLALEEQRPAEQIATEMLAQAMGRRKEMEANLEYWKGLTPREQQVAALVCLNYTNKEIAIRLCISPETVKSHMHNLLAKFGLRSKAQLRQALYDWDFSAWEKS